jgi:hypothetical protein
VPKESLADRLNGKLHRLFLIAMIVWVVLMGFRPMMDNVDLGWHVAQGRWMVQHGSFYRHDVFNYPNLNHPVVDEYPLFQLILYTAWSLGWWGPCLLTALAYALLVGLFFWAAKKLNLIESALLCIAVGLMFLYLQTVFPLRPHLFTYLGIAGFGIFLLRHRDATDWKIFWPVALLQVAWVNGHSGFVIGPGMVGLFGAEMTLRKAIAQRAIPWATMRIWLCVLLLTLLACFVNPFGWYRFYLPFYQDSLESIRAYVGEMEPLPAGVATLFADISVVAALVIVAGLILRRGATAYSFLLLTIFFYVQAQSVQKAWPVFGVFVPLLILGSATFAKPIRSEKNAIAWLGVLSHFVITAVVGIAIMLALDPSKKTSIQSQWREHDHGRSELSLDAAEWMKAHGLDGRLFHRCEDGGWLQQEGFTQTFADTGFGKYDEDFIHEVGLVNERPAFIPHYLAAYHPDFVVCSTFCYRWQYYLRQSGWRLIFYSPNSSVWARPDSRPDLPTVTNDEVADIFDRDIVANGIPTTITLFGRSIIALNSHGLEDFAFAKLTGLPPGDHLAPWYWEAARFCCFAEPNFSAAHRDALFKEADAQADGAVTAEFRAYYKYYAAGDTDGALKILSSIPQEKLSNYEAELLARIDLDRQPLSALQLTRRTDLFDLRNGRHWMYRAEAEEKVGSIAAARFAWMKAVFYYPDDAGLMQAASAFVAKHGDDALAQAIANSNRVYGSDR